SGAAQRGKCQRQSLLRRPHQPAHRQRKARPTHGKKFLSRKPHSQPPSESVAQAFRPEEFAFSIAVTPLYLTPPPQLHFFVSHLPSRIVPSIFFYVRANPMKVVLASGAQATAGYECSPQSKLRTSNLVSWKTVDSTTASADIRSCATRELWRATASCASPTPSQAATTLSPRCP